MLPELVGTIYNLTKTAELNNHAIGHIFTKTKLLCCFCNKCNGIIYYDPFNNKFCGIAEIKCN